MFFSHMSPIGIGAASSTYMPGSEIVPPMPHEREAGRERRLVADRVDDHVGAAPLGQLAARRRRRRSPSG